MDHVQTIQDLFSPVEDLRQVRRRTFPPQLRQPLAEVGLQAFQHQRGLTVYRAVIEQGDHVTGLIGVQTAQEGDFPFQMRAPVAVQSRVGLGHRLGVDQLDGDGATCRVGSRPDLAVTARAAR